MHTSKWLRFKRQLDESFNGDLKQRLSGRVGLLGNFSMVLTIVSFPVILFEEVRLGQTALDNVSLFTWSSLVHALFLVEYIFRAISVSRLSKYVFSFSGFVDLVAFIPLFLHPVFVSLHESRLVSIESIMLNITMLRLVRLLKLWRPLMFMLLRYSAFRNFLADFRINRVVQKVFFKHLQITVLFSSGIIAIGIIMIYFFELGHSSELQSFWDVVWWTLISLVGAGDGTIVETLAGRLMVLLVIIGGVIFFGSIAGTITTIIQDKIHALRMGGSKVTVTDGIVFCGISPDLSRIFHFIQENSRNYLTAPPNLVLINEYIPPEFFELGNVSFVSGSATLPAILERATIYTAKNIYIPVEVYDDPLRQDSMVLQKFMAVVATLLGNNLSPNEFQRIWYELLARQGVTITVELLDIEHRSRPATLLNAYFDTLKACQPETKDKLRRHIRVETIILPSFAGILIAQSLRVHLSTRIFEQLMQLNSIELTHGTVSLFPFFDQQPANSAGLLNWIGIEPNNENEFLIKGNQILDLHYYLFHQGLNLIAVYHNYYALDSNVSNHTYNVQPLYAGASSIKFNPNQDIFIVLARNQFEVAFSEEIVLKHLLTPYKRAAEFPDPRLARLKKVPITKNNDMVINILIGFNQEVSPMLERLALDKFGNYTYLFFHPDYHGQLISTTHTVLEAYGVILYPTYASILAGKWNEIHPLGCLQNTDPETTYRIQVIICNLPEKQNLTDEDSDSLASQLAFKAPIFIHQILQMSNIQPNKHNTKLHVVVETYNKSREIVMSSFVKPVLSEFKDSMELRFDFYNRIDFFSRLKAFVIQHPGLSNVLRKIMIAEPDEAKQDMNLYAVPYATDLVHSKAPDEAYATLMQHNIIPVGFVRGYGVLDAEPQLVFFESYQPNSDATYQASWVDFVHSQPEANTRLIILTWSFVNSKSHLNPPENGTHSTA